MKAHVATDQEAGLIHGVEVTTANIHDAAQLAAILPEAPGDTYGDSAFAGARPEAILRGRGGRPRMVHAGTWGGPEALARLEAHNAEVRRVRARIEKVFGTCKRCYGLGRMRWLGLAKAGLHAGFAGPRHRQQDELWPCKIGQGQAPVQGSRDNPALDQTSLPRTGLIICLENPVTQEILCHWDGQSAAGQHVTA